VLHAWETFARALNRLAPPGVDNAFQTLPGAWTAYEGSRAVLHGLAVRPPRLLPLLSGYPRACSSSLLRRCADSWLASTARTHTITTRTMGALPQKAAHARRIALTAGAECMHDVSVTVSLWPNTHVACVPQEGLGLALAVVFVAANIVTGNRRAAALAAFCVVGAFSSTAGIGAAMLRWRIGVAEAVAMALMLACASAQATRIGAVMPCGAVLVVHAREPRLALMWPHDHRIPRLGHYP